jgi:hypothetical protein
LYPFFLFACPDFWSLFFVSFSLLFLGAFVLLSLAGFHQFLPVNRTSLLLLLLLLIHSATPPEKVKLLLLL